MQLYNTYSHLMTDTSYHIAIWIGIGIGIGIGKKFSSVLGIKNIGKKWYQSTFNQVVTKYIRMMNLLKHLVRIRTNINLWPSELMQCYAICNQVASCMIN